MRSPSEKYMLTLREAAACFTLAKSGSRVMVKRKLFKEFLARAPEI